jgi:hypothetical protein
MAQTIKTSKQEITIGEIGFGAAFAPQQPSAGEGSIPAIL